MLFFGFAMADGMFDGNNVIERLEITSGQAFSLIQKAIEAGQFSPCLNPSHVATIAAMRQRFGIDVPIPETPPKVTLGSDDTLVVMSVRGLPRLTDRREYTAEEISGAKFSFSCWRAAPSSMNDFIGNWAQFRMETEWPDVPGPEGDWRTW